MPPSPPANILLIFAFSAGLAGLAGADMARIEGGSYIRPLERNPQPRTVASFLLDRRQVTNAEFLAFLKTNPDWQRSRINSLFADDAYLRHWQGELDPGPAAPPESPVTNVSWFAARAFLRTQGKRLPTTDEWEFAARASATKADASSDPSFKKTILEWYSQPSPEVLPSVTTGQANIHGIQGLHGLIWEWTSDFNSALATGESRADGSPNAGLFCGGAGLNTNSATEYADFMRFAMRSSLRGNYCLPNLGFRGARGSTSNPTTPNP